MSEEPAGAAAVTVENPHNDDVTRARSKLDYFTGRLAESDDEIAKLEGKVAKFEQFTIEAREAVSAAVREKAERATAVDEATAELEAVEAANPELVAELEGN